MSISRHLRDDMDLLPWLYLPVTDNSWVTSSLSPRAPVLPKCPAKSRSSLWVHHTAAALGWLASQPLWSPHSRTFYNPVAAEGLHIDLTFLFSDAFDIADPWEIAAPRVNAFLEIVQDSPSSTCFTCRPTI